jgi:pre-mRNA-splicing factor SYF1
MKDMEEEVSRNPYYLKGWLNYLKLKEGARPVERYILFERALINLPRSYKLWYLYLNELKVRLKGKKITDKRFIGFIGLFERSLVHMHKMPKIWYAYNHVVHNVYLIILYVYSSFIGLCTVNF